MAEHYLTTAYEYQQYTGRLSDGFAHARPTSQGQSRTDDGHQGISFLYVFSFLIQHIEVVIVHSYYGKAVFSFAA